MPRRHPSALFAWSPISRIHPYNSIPIFATRVVRSRRLGRVIVDRTSEATIAPLWFRLRSAPSL